MGQALDPSARASHARIPKRLLALRGEAHLLARLRAGDEAAFEVLYDRYAGSLLSFCRHMLGLPDEAEDAVQQVFAAAHVDLQRNPRAIELKPWLYAIARNRCLSILRARRDHPESDVEPVTAGLQEQVQQRAELRQLVGDLAELPESQRAALLLTELEDLSHAETASILDCEAGQVKGLVFRAREGLIERRDARLASCEDIRAELASARRGGLRRGRLRHHLAHCEGCTDYLKEVRRQRQMMALILPVVPATGLKRAVLAAVGAGSGAGGAGGLTVAGGSVLGGTAAKIAMVGVLAGGAGVAGESIRHEREAAPAPQAPAVTPTASHARMGPASAWPSPISGAARAPTRRGARPSSSPWTPQAGRPNSHAVRARPAPAAAAIGGSARQVRPPVPRRGDQTPEPRPLPRSRRFRQVRSAGLRPRGRAHPPGEIRPPLRGPARTRGSPGRPDREPLALPRRRSGSQGAPARRPCNARCLTPFVALAAQAAHQLACAGG